MKKLIISITMLFVSLLSFGSDTQLEHKIKQELIVRNIGQLSSFKRDFKVSREVDIERNVIKIEIELEEIGRTLTNEERTVLSNPSLGQEIAKVAREVSGSRLPVRVKIIFDPKRGRDEKLLLETFR